VAKECVIEVKGEPCGADASTRCHVCGEPVCPEHLAEVGAGADDICQPCLEAAQAPDLQEGRDRIAKAVKRLRIAGYPASSRLVVLQTERRFLRGLVEVEYPGPHYWPVGSYRWTGTEENDREEPTIVTESGDVYRRDDDGASTFEPPDGSLVNEAGALAVIAAQLERIVAHR
jgi:hypothetical protein